MAVFTVAIILKYSDPNQPWIQARHVRACTIHYFAVPDVPPPAAPPAGGGAPVPAPVVPVLPVAPLLPAAPSAPGLLQPPSISISATAESATRTLVEDVFIMHPFLKVEDPQPRKTKTLQAGWLLDIDNLPRLLFRKKSKLDRVALISIKIRQFRTGLGAAKMVNKSVQMPQIEVGKPRSGYWIIALFIK